MRHRAVFVTLLVSLTCVSQRGSSDQSGPKRDEVGANALFAISTASVQVTLTIFNRSQTPVFFPTCGEFRICAAYAYVEQRNRNGAWRRTQQAQLGDVSYGKIIRVGGREASHATFQFHPNDWKFPDGKRVTYPGKVRLVILVWPQEQPVGDGKSAMELVTNVFDVPPPPAVWGPSIPIRATSTKQ
jgi:hypothetical protein